MDPETSSHQLAGGRRGLPAGAGRISAQDAEAPNRHSEDALISVSGFQAQPQNLEPAWTLSNPSWWFPGTSRQCTPPPHMIQSPRTRSRTWTTNFTSLIPCNSGLSNSNMVPRWTRILAPPLHMRASRGFCFDANKFVTESGIPTPGGRPWTAL